MGVDAFSAIWPGVGRNMYEASREMPTKIPIIPLGHPLY